MMTIPMANRRVSTRLVPASSQIPDNLPESTNSSAQIVGNMSSVKELSGHKPHAIIASEKLRLENSNSIAIPDKFSGQQTPQKLPNSAKKESENFTGHHSELGQDNLTNSVITRIGELDTQLISPPTIAKASRIDLKRAQSNRATKIPSSHQSEISATITKQPSTEIGFKFEMQTKQKNKSLVDTRTIDLRAIGRADPHTYTLQPCNRTSTPSQNIWNVFIKLFLKSRVQGLQQIMPTKFLQSSSNSIFTSQQKFTK
jgi:hypothetical protein